MIFDISNIAQNTSFSAKFIAQKHYLSMVLALSNKPTQGSFSAMFFEIDKSNKLFFANIEAWKAHYLVIGDRSEPNL